jgi:hypothetical protein
MSAEDQGRGEGDDHYWDVAELARATGTAVEYDRGSKEQQANRECDTLSGSGPCADGPSKDGDRLL